MAIDPLALQHLVGRAEAVLARIEAALPQPLAAPDWSASTAFRYRKRATGSRLEPVRQVAAIRLSALVEIEPQKERLLRNTEQFVTGRAANNVLLTGSRGTGKSSLIKACLNEFAPQGLRLIEVDKVDLVDLPDIVELVAGPVRALRRLLRRPELRRRRARLQGAQIDPRRLGGRAFRERAHLRHQQPPPSAARAHGRQPGRQAHRRRRDPPRRSGRGKDLALRALRPLGELLSLQPERVPGHRRRVAARLSGWAPRPSRPRASPRSSGRWNAARARGGWPTSSPAITLGGTPLERCRRERRSMLPSAC